MKRSGIQSLCLMAYVIWLGIPWVAFAIYMLFVVHLGLIGSLFLVGEAAAVLAWVGLATWLRERAKPEVAR